MTSVQVNSAVDADLDFSRNSPCRQVRPSVLFMEGDTYQGAVSDPLSLHKYLYASVDPVNRVDPNGNFSYIELGAVTGIGAILTGITTGTISKLHGGSFWQGFGRGALVGGALGASLYIAWVQGPKVFGKAIAVGMLQGAAGAVSTYLAQEALGKSRDQSEIWLSFMDGFTAGTAKTAFGGYYLEKLGLEGNTAAEITLNAAISAAGAAFTDLAGNLFTGKPLGAVFKHATFVALLNGVMSILGDSVVATRGANVEGAVKDILSEGLGFAFGVPPSTFLAEEA